MQCLEGKREERYRTANTGVSAADAILLSMTQKELRRFPTSMRRSKLLTLLRTKASRGEARRVHRKLLWMLG